MPNMNVVILAGNLTRDPELRYLPSGAPVCDFSIAFNRSYKKGSGEMVQEAHFFDVQAWNRQAEVVAEHLKKGAPVAVEGMVLQNRWETQDGQKRSKLYIRANRVHFLGKRPDGSTAPTPGADEMAGTADDIGF